MWPISVLKFRKTEKEVTNRGPTMRVIVTMASFYKLVFSPGNLYNCERKKSFR
jgi:hypothetical protein